MENEQLFGNPELNSGPPAGQLTPPCYLSLNWDQSMNHGPHFDSALSSLVSSPSSATPAAAAESVVIRELIGRLGSICNSGEISPTSRYHSTNTSCYSTPLNSPPKLNLSMMEHNQLQLGRGGLPPISGSQLAATHPAPFSADPSFVERAARLSCFGGSRSYSSGLAAQFGLSETGKLSRVSSSQSLKMGGSQMGGGAPESGNEIPIQDGIQFEMDMVGRAAQEESSMSELITMSGDASLKKAGESNARKRKAALKGKGKESPLSSIAVNTPKVAEEEDVNLKRCKSSEINGTKRDLVVKPKTEQNSGESSSGDADKKQGKDAKSPEPPKDYIHVRARRGQATDSHSLAERVRREKISERMKFLQDLVPGCNKVTGKAVMLDEIINYVQSLQRQVEFLSMKLAAVNPSLDFNMESSIPKEMNQTCGPMPHHSVYPLESTSTAIMYPHQPQGTSLQSTVSNGFETQYSMNPSDSGLGRTPSMQLPPLHGFGDANSQLGTFWEDDLQSVVQMGIGQNQEAAFFSESFHGRLSRRLG